MNKEFTIDLPTGGTCTFTDGAWGTIGEKLAREQIAARCPAAMPCYPLRPVNGGRLELAPPKRGTWYAEPKFNGWRAFIHAPSRTMFNRHGARLSIAGEFAVALGELAQLDRTLGATWYDCEALERRHKVGQGTLLLLDALISKNYLERRVDLEGAMDEQFEDKGVLQVGDRPAPDSLYLAPSHSDAAELYALCQRMNDKWNAPFYEGVVMKRADSFYERQSRSASEETPHWSKHRFIN